MQTKVKHFLVLPEGLLLLLARTERVSPIAETLEQEQLRKGQNGLAPAFNNLHFERLVQLVPK